MAKELKTIKVTEQTVINLNMIAAIENITQYQAAESATKSELKRLQKKKKPLQAIKA